MIGGLKQTTSRFAIAAAAGLFTGGIALTPVHAASLGGDCCADLEERVAELEATTVRKGNRKVSVKLSGQVIRQILFWDDGQDNDVYYTDGGITHTRFRITGSATISPGRTVGYHMEHDYATSNDPKLLNNGTGAPGSKTANASVVGEIRKADIWVKDKTLGKLSWGRGDTASNGTAEVDISGTTVSSLYSGVTDNVGGFTFRTAGGGFSGVTIGSTYSNIDGGSRRDRVRYDTPTLGGFTFSTSVWADDGVDFAVRFKKEWNSVRCASALGYQHDTDGKDDDTWRFSTSASCIHAPSGLNLTVAYGDIDRDNVDEDKEFFYIKLGIYRRWNSHGKTAIAVHYGNGKDFVSEGGELDSWGVAVVQRIDSAAMEIFASYMNYEYSDRTSTRYEDFDAVTVGGRVKF